MTPRASRLLVALLACAIAVAVATPAAGTSAVDAQVAGARKVKKMRKLLHRRGLAKLPSVAGALAAHGGKHSAGLEADVTGTPPTLVSIPDSSPKDLFWRPGVVDAIAAGTATGEQCSEFWSGQSDGQSGGMGACHMAENVGYSLGQILGGDSSLCYMKRFPTRANLRAGAITLLNGSFPDDDPTKLFSVPAGSASRVVKVSVTGDQDGQQDVFLKVHGEDENGTNGDLYAVDLWFCRGAEVPKGFDHIRITSNGQFTSEEQQAHDTDANVDSVAGWVTFSNGEIVYDTTKSRHVLTAGQQQGQGANKADEEIRSDNTVAMREYDTYGGGTRFSYTVSSFSGTGVDTLRFLAGAFKERQSFPGNQQSQGDMVGSTEFRSTYYAASPGSALESGVTDIDFDTDPFYASPPSINVDASAYSCSTPADVELALDFTTPEGSAIRAQCEHHQFDQMHFCHDDPAVHAAEMNAGPACFGPH